MPTTQHVFNSQSEMVQSIAQEAGISEAKVGEVLAGAWPSICFMPLSQLTDRLAEETGVSPKQVSKVCGLAWQGALGHALRAKKMEIVSAANYIAGGAR